MKIEEFEAEVELACLLNNELKNSSKEEEEFKKLLTTNRKQQRVIIFNTPNFKQLNIVNKDK